MTLSHFHPHIYAEFLKGHVTVNKSSHAFSNLTIGQVHDQYTAVVEDDGGAVGQTECPTFKVIHDVER